MLDMSYSTYDVPILDDVHKFNFGILRIIVKMPFIIISQFIRRILQNVCYLSNIFKVH